MALKVQEQEMQLEIEKQQEAQKEALLKSEIKQASAEQHKKELWESHISTYAPA